MLGAASLAVLLLGAPGRPLLWNDEADTAVIGQRVLRHGLPVVTGEPTLAYLVRPEHVRSGGVYTAGVWGQYYLAALGVWLAEGVDDLYARTARVRLVFALTGYAALAALAIGLSPLAGPGPWRIAFVAGVLIADCVSISLILHLREVRYHAPAVLLTSLVCVLHARRHLLGRLSLRGWLVGGSLASIALFDFFPPIFGSLGLVLAGAIGVRIARGGATGRLRRWLVEVSPLAVSAVCALGIFVAMGLLEQAEFVSATSTTRSYARNLHFAVSGLLRFEFLGPALIAHAGVVWVTRGRIGSDASTERRTAFSGFVLALVAVHVLLVSTFPLVWERYLIPLSPLLGAALVLDLISLVGALRAVDPAVRWRPRAACAVAALAAVASLAVRAPELRGRVEEIARPVQGPLDALIPYLKEHYRDPGSLVIATNYEGPAYTYYLGSHVVVGYYGQNMAEDSRASPDVIVPRPWPRGIRTLLAMSRAATYRRVGLPVRQQRTNNAPILWPGSPGGVRHRFENEPPAAAEQEVVLLERVAAPR